MPVPTVSLERPLIGTLEDGEFGGGGERGNGGCFGLPGLILFLLGNLFKPVKVTQYLQRSTFVAKKIGLK